MEIIAQVFGILAFIASVVSFQMKTYRQILWVQTLCTVLFVIHFLLLARCGQADAVTGAVLNGISTIRDVILLATEGNGRRSIRRSWPPCLPWQSWRWAC